MTQLHALGDILLRAFKQRQKAPEHAPLCFIGFDGFTDEIIKVVETRQDIEDFTPFSSIASFGKRILDASGRSCNFELIVHEKKLGGNAPIMANALLKGAVRLIFAGPIGVKGKIEPLFKKMVQKCEQVIALGPSAHSDALEFHDGKIILGKLENLKNVNYSSLLKQISLKQLISALNSSDLFVSANWTMLPMMNPLWQSLIKDVLPSIEKRPQGQPRWMFVDLADPAKRTDRDLKEALLLLGKMGSKFNVILGLNYAEATRVASVLKLGAAELNPKKLELLGQSICKAAKLNKVVVHATKFAVASSIRDSCSSLGPYTPTPLFSTGAGDNFNAGFCNALLSGCSMEDCLVSGVTTSGYYVRYGLSPSMLQLKQFMQGTEPYR